MALALENPNIRRRINKIARSIVKEGLAPGDAVAAYYAKPKGERRQRGGKAIVAHVKSGAAKKQTPAARKAYAAAKRAVAHLLKQSMAAQGKSTKGFVTRSISTAKGRVYHKGKQTKNARGKVVLSAAKAREANALRKAFRSAFGAHAKVQDATLAQIGSIWDPKTSGMYAAQEYLWSLSPEARAAHRRPDRVRGKRKAPKARAKAPKADRRSRKVKSPKGASKLVKSLMAQGLSKGQAVAIISKGGSLRGPHTPKWATKKGLGSIANPRRNGSALIPMGALAFTNPADMSGWAMGLASGAVLAGAGLTAVRLAGPKLKDYYAMVPGIGQQLSDNSGLTTGVLLSAVPMAAAAAGYRMGGQYGTMIAGALAAAGTTVAAVWLSDLLATQLASATGLEDGGLGDLGVSALGPMHGLALEGMGGIGFGSVSALGDAMGDGFASQVAPLTATTADVDFGQASLADAAYSGADFSAQEGQALLNGPAHFVGCYGRPTHRMGGSPAGTSHLAGRPGHRWAWMVKMLGWNKTRAICALPPAERVKLIAKIRQAALNAYTESSTAEAASSAESIAAAHSSGEPIVSGISTNGAGAHGASGPGDLGAPNLFMGE